MAEGKPQHAARLLGAAEALRKTTGVLVSTADRGEYERHVSSARAGLEEKVFAAAWAEGRAISLEQVIEYARSVLDS